MSGKGILVVGMRGSGKTTKIKSMLEKTHPESRLVYDINKEYLNLYKKPFVNFDLFTEQAIKVKHAFIVFEEATIFLSNRGSNQDIRQLLVQARHNDNTLLFVFHSLRSIPKYVFDLCDYVILHKTNDNEAVISSRFEHEEFTQCFLRVKNMAFIKGTNNKQYSPSEFFSIY